MVAKSLTVRWTSLISLQYAQIVSWASFSVGSRIKVAQYLSKASESQVLRNNLINGLNRVDKQDVILSGMRFSRDDFFLPIIYGTEIYIPPKRWKSNSYCYSSSGDATRIDWMTRRLSSWLKYSTHLRSFLLNPGIRWTIPSRTVEGGGCLSRRRTNESENLPETSDSRCGFHEVWNFIPISFPIAFCWGCNFPRRIRGVR